jgi:hypothetical protein
MSAIRLAPLPIDHVLAEMAVLPLASEAALRLGVTEFDPFLPNDKTASLWREAEHQILGCFPAFSVDEAVSIRDFFWFGLPGNEKIPLHTYLRWLAQQFLEVHGHTATPTLPQQRGNIAGQSESDSKAAQARLAWRWLSFALPPDLLLAALAGNGNHPQEIDLLTQVLERHLHDNGYAEIHQHIGAALEFPLLWACAVKTIRESGFKDTAFESPGAEFGEGKQLARWLLRAAIARYVMASFLGDKSGAHEDFKSYMKTFVYPKVLLELGPVALSSLILSLSDLRAGNIEESRLKFAQLQDLYSLLLGAGFIVKSFPDTLEKIAEIDPISVFLPGASNPEMRFAALGLDYLDSNLKDQYFAVLFWQAIRVRILFYRHVVQHPMTPGLQWFVRFFDRMRPAKQSIKTPLNVKSAAHLDGLHQGLRSLEFRTAPDVNRSSILQYLKDIDITHHSMPIEMGLVYHFTKNRGDNASKGKHEANWRLSHADPGFYYGKNKKTRSTNPTGYRYASYYNRKRNEAQALAWVLWHFPCSLGLIRGIDVCTNELGVPTWVLAPLFRYVRETSNSVSAYLYSRCSVPVPSLRVTAHTGEDFIHLLTGLRNVDEAVRRFEMREGDRIGHGVALGVDPIDWCKRTGRIPMPCEDRLFDLSWEWVWYARESINPPPGRAAMLEREIARLSHKIFGKPLLPYDIELFVEYLYNEDRLGQLGFPIGPLPKVGLYGELPLILLRRYLTEVSVFWKGRETEWVDPQYEGEVLSMLQAELRKKLGQRGIAVEVNPSSNLLIGDMSDLAKHPLWRLRPPPRSGIDAPPVSICIGTDDPLTFATNLRQEYQFVHDALVLSGCSEAEANQWLDEVRKTGLDYRFTLNKDRKPKFALPKNALQPERINPFFNLGSAFVKLPP